MKNQFFSLLITSFVICVTFDYGLAQSITTSPVAGSPFCAGAAVNVPYTITGVFLNVPANNVFTAQLSDASGSFASPVVIGTRTAINAGTVSATIPITALGGAAYRIRVVSSNPGVTGTDNLSNLTIKALAITAPTIAITSFCQGQAFNIFYTVNCTFSNTPTNNVFTALLSDASGSFASPTTIGTLTSTVSGTISASIPGGTPAGIGYRIMVTASNPAVSSPDNGSNLSVAATVGNPTLYGSSVWNVYCYLGSVFTGYAGYYTENGTAAPNLSFNSQNRWTATTTPSNADASSGLAYQGCAIPGGGAYSFIYKRANFPCGYYQIDIPSHDDVVTLFVNGTQVFTSPCCTANLLNVWSGFLGPTSTVDVNLSNTGGNSNLAVNFTSLATVLTMSPAVTVCSGAGSSTTLTVSSPLALNYTWSPATSLNTTSGASVIVTNLLASTTYTATGTDATTGCSISNIVTVTVAAAPTTAMAASVTTICAGVSTATLTATGANTYSWSPAAGLSATTGNVVIASPTVNTTYTVTGNNNCSTNNASKTINVQTVPAAPPTATFGSGTWNVYAHNNTTLSNYYGYYTENSLSFNTNTRWAVGSGPTVANAATGLGYSGCTFGSTNYSMSFKRTNIPCGYYQIDIPYHDDDVTLLINGTQVFQHIGCCDIHTNVWNGFLNTSSTVEFRLVNNAGPGQLQVAFSLTSPLTLSPPATICAGTNSALTAASSIAGATYAWTVSPNTTPGLSFSNASISSPIAQTVATTPATNYTCTCTITDAAGTLCTASSNVIITVNALPSTAVTPTSITTSCPSAGITLTASGANTYTWSPTTNLTPTSGYQVVATPTLTTTYTVTGSNNCSTLDATTTITVNPLPAVATFPSGTWNVYGFNSVTVGTNYVGYYTENGSGVSGYDFNTGTRWTSGAAPSTANATNGTAWQGCVMNATNMSMSFKRTGFACGIYQINIVNHDDDFKLIINGTQVAQHVGCCDAHTAIWTGVLGASTQVEYQLVQGGGGSLLSVQFVQVTLPNATQSIWLGATSTDWFTVGNWCNAIPSSTIDAIIPAAGPQFMPTISNSGAQVKNITINAAVAAGTYNVAIPAATLATGSSFDLSVFANWTNNGTFTSNTGSVTFAGLGVLSNTVSSSATEVFNNLIVNNSKNTTISSGLQQVKGNLTLTLGKLFQNGGLEILNGGTTSGASNASYVDGTVKKTGNAAFTFPVGNNGFYRPIAISAPSLVTDAFTAQYFNISPSPAPYPNAQRDVTLDHVSAAEYWMLNLVAGASTPKVTLSWNTNSGGVGIISRLRVAGWNIGAGKWKDLGNGGTTGTTTSGTVVTTGAVTTFGPFTLASTDNSNPLPVQLTSFNCKLDAGTVLLTWTTASELNSNYFSIERSSDGISFQFVGRASGAGTTSDVHHYSIEDVAPLQGTSYYRIKQVDYDGKEDYFELCAVENWSDSTIKIYPNPATNSVFVDFDKTIPYAISIWNGRGERLTATTTITDKGVVIDASGLSTGLYIIHVQSGEKISRNKVMVVK